MVYFDIPHMILKALSSKELFKNFCVVTYVCITNVFVCFNRFVPMELGYLLKGVSWMNF